MKTTQMMEVSEKERRMIERLRNQPEMGGQIEGMLDEIEDGQAQARDADEAEEALVRRVREMGRLGLNRWAQNKARQSAESSPEAGARRGGKKN